MQVRNGKTFPYQLVLNVKGNEVAGYSQTKLFDGTEPKTTVTGFIDKKKHSVKFKESTAENTVGHSISCFASVTLYYKFDNGRYVMTGPFKGADEYDMYCGEGFVVFDDPDNFKSIFCTDSLKSGAFRDNQFTKATRSDVSDYSTPERGSDSRYKKGKNGNYEDLRPTNLALNGRINSGQQSTGPQKDGSGSLDRSQKSGSENKVANKPVRSDYTTAENNATKGASSDGSSNNRSGKRTLQTNDRGVENIKSENPDKQKSSLGSNSNAGANSGPTNGNKSGNNVSSGQNTRVKDGGGFSEGKLSVQNKNEKTKNTPASQNQRRSTKELVVNKPQREIADTIEDGAEYEITTGVKKQFDWKTDSCIVEVYDGGVIDGDIISVAFNNTEVLTRYALVKKKYKFKLSLKEKVNKIEIFAENEGKSPPNTANITLTDGNRHYRLKAYNKIGESAEILLKRK